MVSEAELVERLRDLLRSSDLSKTTAAILRRKLEEDFGIDLTEKKAFIREQIDVILWELNEKEEEDGEGEEVKAEEEEAKTQEEEVKEEEVKAEEEEERSGGGEDEEEEEDEGTSNGGASSSRKRRSNGHTVEVKKRGGGFTKLCSLSPPLQEFVGVSELARTEVVKRLWAYIRENNLQDPSNRRKIICDDRLRNLFKVNSIDMFQMSKALSKHIWPLSTENGQVTSTPKEKPQKKLREDSDDIARKEKRQRGNHGFLSPLPLSDAMTKFIGTGENALPRSDVVKRIWVYIKQNNLQDPADKRNIICDDKLKELFQVDSFVGFTVSKLLASHFVKTKE